MSSRMSQAIHPIYAGGGIDTLNSGDTGAVTENTGSEIDLQPSNGRRYRRANVSFVGRATNTSNKRWKITANLEHSTATGSGYADLGSTYTLLAPTSSGEVTFPEVSGTAMDFEEDLQGANRYLRLKYTARAVTDTGGNTTATGAVLNLMQPVLTLLDANREPASTAG